MFFHIAAGDIDRGILKRKYTYLLFIIVIIFLCMITCLKLENLIASGRVVSDISIADLYMVFYKGSNIVNPNEARQFYMTEQYFLISLGMAYVIGNYAVKDLYGVGTQIIIRSRNAKWWWYSKIIWCLISDVIIHISVYAVMLFISVIKGWSVNFSVNASLLKALGYQNSDKAVSSYELFLLCFVVPFLSMFSLALIQMFFSILISPVIALILVVVEMVVSVYSGSEIFFSNGIMIVRNSLFYSGGTDSYGMMLWSFLSCVAFMIAGNIYLSKTDLLGKRNY